MANVYAFGAVIALTARSTHYDIRGDAGSVLYCVCLSRILHCPTVSSVLGMFIHPVKLMVFIINYF